MFVERLEKKDIIQLINIIQEATKQEDKSTESDILQMEIRQHSDGLNYRFVKMKNFMKCWMSDFTCATRIFDASSIYRAFMGRKFKEEYINAYRKFLTDKNNEKVENEIRHFESILNI